MENESPLKILTKWDATFEAENNDSTNGFCQFRLKIVKYFHILDGFIWSTALFNHNF